MAGWHHRLDGSEFEWTLGVGDGQGGLACCNSWGHKESDMTEQLNWTELMDTISSQVVYLIFFRFYILSLKDHHILISTKLLKDIFIFIWLKAIQKFISGLYLYDLFFVWNAWSLSLFCLFVLCLFVCFTLKIIEQCQEYSRNSMNVLDKIYYWSCSWCQLYFYISLCALFTETMVSKVQAKRLEENLKSHGSCRHVILFWLVQQL